MLAITVPVMLKWSFMSRVTVTHHLLFTAYECLTPKINGIYKQRLDFILNPNANLV